MGRSLSRRPPAGMISGWTFNHGDERDLGYAGNALTLDGATNSGTNISLDGTNDRAFAPDDSFYTFGNGSTDKPFSLSAWVYLDAYETGADQILTKRTSAGGAGSAEWIFNVKSTGPQFGCYTTDGGAFIGSRGTATVSLSGWTHLVGTYSGGGVWTGFTLYAQGVVLSNNNISFGSYTATGDTDQPVRVGSMDGTTRFLDGQMDDLRIYDRELTATEVATIYQQGHR